MWFHGRPSNPLMSSQLQNMFKVEEVNCICVDWKKGSRTTYMQAASNVRVVGAQVAQMIGMLSVSGWLDGQVAEAAGGAPGSRLGKMLLDYIFEEELERTDISPRVLLLKLNFTLVMTHLGKETVSANT